MTNNTTNASEKCTNCATTSCEMQKAGLACLCEQFSKMLVSCKKKDALHILKALKNNLETFTDCLSASCLIKRVDSTSESLSEDAETYITDGGKCACKCLIAEVKAFIAEPPKNEENKAEPEDKTE